MAQGINKQTSYKRQTGLGTPASGAGGQILRRRTSVFQAPPDTFESDEIVSHQQSTGVGIGVVKPSGKIDGLLSPGTYADLISALLRKDLAVGASATGMTIAVAASGQNWTLTRSAGSFLTDGFKVGDVGRLTAGSFNVLNSNKNVQILGVTATALTVKVVNGSAMFAESAIAAATFAVTGKKTLAPMTGHTNIYYSFEEWYPDTTPAASELYSDEQISSIQFDLPATGNAGISISTVGRKRSLGSTRILTSPASETTTDILTAVNGIIIVNGVAVDTVTGVQLTVDGQVTHSDPSVGSNIVDDVQRGDIKVSGNFSSKFGSNTLQLIMDARNTTSLALCVAEDGTANSDFVVINIPMIKLTGDTPDDGKKAIVRSYPFIGQINSAGGAALATDQTIFAFQDSAA